MAETRSSQVDLTARADLAGYREKVPGYGTGLNAIPATVQSTVVASLDLRLDATRGLGSSDLRPFFSLGVTQASAQGDDGLGGDFTKPHLALGIFGPIGTGDFALRVETGHLAADVRGTSATLSYSLAF